MSAPPTRGWSSIFRYLGIPCIVCPAYAGMVPVGRAADRGKTGLPRLRGDGPRLSLDTSSKSLSAPPTRGWSALGNDIIEALGVCPAYAGMVLCRQQHRQGRARLPRLRGDGPPDLPSLPATKASAPPTRGWSLLMINAIECLIVCPAYAGMVPVKDNKLCLLYCLPRLRGDGPVISTSSTPESSSAPPTRGWSLHGRTCRRKANVCPAYAGMVPSFAEDTVLPRGLPRLRGDGPWLTTRHNRRIKSAPPTRGWSRIPSDKPRLGQVCPAYAGMVPLCVRGTGDPSRLPRLRGDGPANHGSGTRSKTSAPPTRGWSRDFLLNDNSDTVCPAYAGMVLTVPMSRPRSMSLPRLRGDGPL